MYSQYHSSCSYILQFTDICKLSLITIQWVKNFTTAYSDWVNTGSKDATLKNQAQMER